MNAGTCPREDELLDALASRFVGPELEAHVASCASCSELRLVAGGVLDDRIAAIAEASVPTAGTMWFRMQMRQRLEAQTRARRSLLIGQAATFVIGIALLAAVFGHDIASQVREVIEASPFSTWLLLALATPILAAPIAGYVAIRQK